ncbi:MAG TPA: phosphonate metabolism protein/1,5-bisphosphokinase (PRPP-forming) PhnN [Puia sp.]|nr:phosphonate metabolism protein/1,5-bisphosphokinase (PRPP-forming) PhnN [Puia sp.]
MPQLIYIVGASGVGKDSLMLYARQQLNGSIPLVFAHRYITRPATQGSENHVALTVEEFLNRKAGGLFALDWESHGLYYGIGIEIDVWMERGFLVVVNGSRQYLPVAKERYPDMMAIVIEADPEIIRHRLESRGREKGEEIEQRIRRQPSLDVEGLIRISNNGLLEEGGEDLISVLRRVPAGS